VVFLVMAWSPLVRRINAGRFEVEHPGDYATLNSNHSRDSTSQKQFGRPIECFRVSPPVRHYGGKILGIAGRAPKFEEQARRQCDAGQEPLQPQGPERQHGLVCHAQGADVVEREVERNQSGIRRRVGKRQRRQRRDESVDLVVIEMQGVDQLRERTERGGQRTGHDAMPQSPTSTSSGTSIVTAIVAAIGPLRR
jgi:hypothetical protein